MDNWPLLNAQKNYFSFSLFWGMFRPFYYETIVDFSPNMYEYFLAHISFNALFFFTLPLKYYLYKKCKSSNKVYLLLIFTFMEYWYYNILRSIHLSFQSHQMCTLKRIWEWRGIGTDCPGLQYGRSCIKKWDNVQKPPSLVYIKNCESQHVKMIDNFISFYFIKCSKWRKNLC